MTMLNTQSSWNVGRPGAQCAACGAALLANQGCWAALCERMAGAATGAGEKPESGSQKPEARSGKPEARSQKAEEAVAVSPFVRVDFCEKCWGEGQRPDGGAAGREVVGGAVMFSFWKTVIPAPEQKKRLLVEDSVLVDLFQRMDGRTELRELRFRFVLALILMRKRLLKYEGMEETGQKSEGSSQKPEVGTTEGAAAGPAPEVWMMRLRGTEDAIKVINPHLNEEQIGEVSGQLSSILAEEV